MYGGGLGLGSQLEIRLVGPQSSIEDRLVKEVGTGIAIMGTDATFIGSLVVDRERMKLSRW